MTKPSVYRVGILADLHCGSQYALVPPSFRPLKHGPSGAFMSYMYDQCWTDFTKKCPPLDVLILNGDCMEGEHPTLKSAPDAIDTSPLRQVDMAVETLWPLRKKVKHIWLIRGTGFHEGKWSQALEDLGRELNAEKWADRRWSGEVLDGTIGGLTFNVSHAQTTGAIYPLTTANRTVWFATMCQALATTISADIIIRSHTHASAKAEVFDKWILSTRAWKLVNPHAISRMEYYRACALLSLGGHILTISPDGVMWKDEPYKPYKSEPRQLA